MIKISSETKNAFKSDASHKELVIRIPQADITLRNEDIVSESLELKEAIESSENLTFQGCISSSLALECFTLVDDTLEGMWIEADITADETETIPIFRGYITEVTNQTHEEFTTKIRAYDALYQINRKDVTSWYYNLLFPMTIQAFRNSFFQHVGVSQVADYLPNDGVTIQKTIDDKVIIGSRIIKAICQINGRFGRISRTGRFEYVHLTEAAEALYPAEDLFPADDIFPSDENAVDNVLKAHYTNISFENYRVASISKVQIVAKDGHIAASSGSGTNVFTLKDNPFVWGMNSSTLNQVARNLYNTIQGLWYTPAEVKCVGLPYVECGDFVLMSARLSIIRAYVLTRTLKGIQAITDSYKAPGDKKQPVYVPDLQAQSNANAQAITNEASTRQTQITNEANTRQTQINAEASARQQADAAEANARQNAINAEANIRANQVQAVNVRCDNLVSKDAQIESIVATKASITDLQATNATIAHVNAQLVNTNNLVAQKASITELNAVRATVNYINARYVTAQQVTTAVNNALQGSITCGSLRTGSISLYDGSGYTNLYTLLDRRYVTRY